MRPEEIFEQIYDLMRYGNTITSIDESGTTSTINTSQIYTLVDDMLVEIGNNVYQVSNVTVNGLSNYSYDIEATSITATEWQLALYYEYGRALEIGNTLKDQGEDPENKNKRFPLMWLLTDINKDENFSNINFEADIVIGFIYLSEKNWKAKKRLEDRFEPILDPLVSLFKTVLNNSPGSRYFTLPFGETLNISETDKFKYGSIEGNTNVFNEITDAVQLEMTLKFSSFGTCTIESPVPPTPPTPPAVIEDGNTVGWYIADDLTTIFKNGSNLVSQWNDKLGSGHDLIQAVELDMPEWSTNGVKFDGIRQFMKTLPFTFVQPEMIYIVFKQITWIHNRVVLDGNAQSSGLLFQSGTSPTIRMYAGGATAPSTSNLLIDTFSIVRCLFNSTTASTLQVNENTKATSTLTGLNNMNGFTLGVNGVATTSFSNIQVKEVIKRKIADTTQGEQDIYDYLATKYSI